MLIRTLLIAAAAGMVSGCLPGTVAVAEPTLARIADDQNATRTLLDENNRTQTALLARLDAMEKELESARQYDKRLHAMQRRLVNEFKEMGALCRLPMALDAQTKPAQSTPAPGKLVIGAVERVYLAPPGNYFKARIDTGATTSSLDATNIQRFERDGDDWVRFDLILADSDKPVTLERRLERTVTIIQSNEDNGERRPVIALELVIGSVVQKAEFTLSDRSHMDYSLLIGRNVLKDLMIVDVALKNNAPPVLPPELEEEAGHE